MRQSARIRLAFSAGFLLLASVAVSIAFRTQQWQQEARWIERTHTTIEELDALALESDFLAQGRPAAQSALKRADHIVQLLDGVSMQAENAAVLRALVRQQVSRQGEPQKLRASVFELISRMNGEEHRLLEERMRQRAEALMFSRLLVASGMILALSFIAFAGVRVVQDTTRRTDAERELAAREEECRQVIELAGDLIFRTDLAGRFTFCNPACLSLMHYTREEVLGRSYLRMIRPDKRAEAERFYLRQLVRRQKNTYYELPVVDGHGRVRWIGQNVQLNLHDGRPAGFQAIARDITDRREAEFDLQRSRSFIERIALTTPGILYVFDIEQQRNVFSNREITAVLGYRPEEFRDSARPVIQIVHPDDQPMIRAHYAAMLHAQDGEIRRLEFRARHTSGHWVWLSGRETPFGRGADSLVKQVVGILQDITARKAAQDKLAYQANYDALTGLPNRHFFWTRLQGILRRASIDFSETSVCLFDIDHFKEINDRYGHAAGDEVLEEVGNLVRAELRPNEVAGRLGGDEFCLVLPGTDCDEAARLADRIRQRLGTLAFGMDAGATFSVTATFGVARSRTDMEAKELMEAADRALYQAKSAGRNRVCQDV